LKKGELSSLALPETLELSEIFPLNLIGSFTLSLTWSLEDKIFFIWFPTFCCREGVLLLAGALKLSSSAISGAGSMFEYMSRTLCFLATSYSGSS
jgi:hypothetical protein